MDLGINGRKAIVCASSQGLGLACATSLAREGCVIFINGRDEARLDKAVAEIQAATGVRAAPVVADINTEPGRAKLVAACPEEFGEQRESGLVIPSRSRDRLVSVGHQSREACEQQARRFQAVGFAHD